MGAVGVDGGTDQDQLIHSRLLRRQLQGDGRPQAMTDHGLATCSDMPVKAQCFFAVGAQRRFKCTRFAGLTVPGQVGGQ
ncbi:hypothetical protein D3C72_2344110 [compost metagenome]